MFAGEADWRWPVCSRFSVEDGQEPQMQSLFSPRRSGCQSWNWGNNRIDDVEIEKVKFEVHNAKTAKKKKEVKLGASTTASESYKSFLSNHHGRFQRVSSP